MKIGAKLGSTDHQNAVSCVLAVGCQSPAKTKKIKIPVDSATSKGGTAVRPVESPERGPRVRRRVIQRASVGFASFVRSTREEGIPSSRAADIVESPAQEISETPPVTFPRNSRHHVGPDVGHLQGELPAPQERARREDARPGHGYGQRRARDEDQGGTKVREATPEPPSPGFWFSESDWSILDLANSPRPTLFPLFLLCR